MGGGQEGRNHVSREERWGGLRSWLDWSVQREVVEEREEWQDQAPAPAWPWPEPML